MASPSRPTVKRLFAVSGNRCAFPKCASPLVDPQSGSIIGEVCHIKGDKPEAARYDVGLTDDERHAFENLMLLCNIHHKIVDDDEVAYTVDRLVRMKAEHEGKHCGPLPVDDATAERFVTVTINNSAVLSHGQVGGQMAHSITNIYQVPPTDEAIHLDATLKSLGDLPTFTSLGCAGMKLTVINRGARAAKLQSALMLVGNVDVMSGLQSGFGTDFGYSPVEGSSQVLTVDLIPLSKPNAEEGYVLSRDDVCRFFCPLPTPATTLALRAKPEDVSVVVRFFDDSEQVVVQGERVQEVLKDLFEAYRDMPGRPNATMKLGVRVLSKTRPNVGTMGQVNTQYVPFAKPDPSDNQES